MGDTMESIMESVTNWRYLNRIHPTKLKIRSDVLGCLASEAFPSGCLPAFEIKTFMGLPVEEMREWDAPEWVVQ